MLFDPQKFVATAAAVAPNPSNLRTLGYWQEVFNVVYPTNPKLDIDPSINDLDGSESPEWLAASREVRAKLVNAVMPSFAPYIDAKSLFADPPLARTMADLGIVDWSGEAVYLLGALALLNTVNVIEMERVDRGKLNKARARNGKPPLAEHRVLKIHPRIRRHMVGDSSAHGHRELRATLVRGHWKARRTGVFFWRPYARGRGVPVDKTYLVE
jgi:hypothetical protein